jgi:glycosyltransferase involved in cell wall biosynthesis
MWNDGPSPSSTEAASLPADVRPQVWIIVPAYHEAATIEMVVRDLRTAFPNVVVVDDGSVDDTYEIARRAGAIVLRHAINRGQGAALQTGIEFALRRGAEYLVTFDADGQHQVADIDALVMPVRQGRCEVALGSRFLGSAVNLPTGRRILLRLGVWFTRLVNGLALTDTHNGLRCFSRAAAAQLDIQLDGMAHASEIIDHVSRRGLTYLEVPVRIHYTPYSMAKGQSSRGAVRIALQYLVSKFVR